MKILPSMLSVESENDFNMNKRTTKPTMTSKDSDQSVHSHSMARDLVHSSLNSLEAVEGKCDQQRL